MGRPDTGVRDADHRRATRESVAQPGAHRTARSRTPLAARATSSAAAGHPTSIGGPCAKKPRLVRRQARRTHRTRTFDGGLAGRRDQVGFGARDDENAARSPPRGERESSNSARRSSRLPPVSTQRRRLVVRSHGGRRRHASDHAGRWPPEGPRPTATIGDAPTDEESTPQTHEPPRTARTGNATDFGFTEFSPFW